MARSQRPSTVNMNNRDNKDVFEFQTAQEYLDAIYNAELKNAKKLAEFKRTLEKERVKSQQAEAEAFARKLNEFERNLEKENIKLSNKARQEFLENFEKQRRIEEQKSIIEY